MADRAADEHVSLSDYASFSISSRKSIASAPSNGASRERGRREQFRRMLRYRLGIPMMRSRHSPEHTARGVMMGMFWAMTPTFGLQMLGIFLTWLTCRKLLNWDFSLANGLAWTWITNAITILPCYYLFYVTGQIMMADFGNISGYAAFVHSMEAWSAIETGFWQRLLDWFAHLVSEFGLPILIGSIPWALGTAYVSYQFSYAFVVKYRRRRRARLKAAAERSAA